MRTTLARLKSAAETSTRQPADPPDCGQRVLGQQVIQLMLRRG
jgi:hypothetical protein